MHLRGGDPPHRPDDPQRASTRLLLAFADWRLGPDQVVAVVADDGLRLHHHLGVLLLEASKWGTGITLVTSDLHAARAASRHLVVLAAPHRHRVLDVAEVITGIVTADRRAKVMMATTRRQLVRDVERLIPVPLNLLDVEELTEPEGLGGLAEP